MNLFFFCKVPESEAESGSRYGVDSPGEKGKGAVYTRNRKQRQIKWMILHK
jgi:hypothetical protein